MDEIVKVDSIFSSEQKFGYENSEQQTTKVSHRPDSFKEYPGQEKVPT